MDVDTLLHSINVKKLEHKAWAAIGGLLAGGLAVILLSKFINDNWTFRINKIANKPANTEETNKLI